MLRADLHLLIRAQSLVPLFAAHVDLLSSVSVQLLPVFFFFEAALFSFILHAFVDFIFRQVGRFFRCYLIMYCSLCCDLS